MLVHCFNVIFDKTTLLYIQTDGFCQFKFNDIIRNLVFLFQCDKGLEKIQIFKMDSG